jgi:3',5'-cyclic AMP phosphodiesterase CpdA
VSAYRIIQVSDTHLGVAKPWFTQNFAAMARIAAARRPDLVINTGDISFHGDDDDGDLAFARDCHASLEVPWRALPGNHDLGDNPLPGVAPDGHVITAARRDRYLRYFGDDYWTIDAGDWLLIGLNAQLLGSGLAAEVAQWAFLEAATSRAEGRPVALFLHKPLFKVDPGETEIHQRYVAPPSRARLLGALAGVDLRLVASGHVHQHRVHTAAGVDHCWCPSTAFLIPDWKQPWIGTKHVGYVAYTLHADRAEVEVVEAPELVNQDLDAYLPPTAT